MLCKRRDPGKRLDSLLTAALVGFLAAALICFLPRFTGVSATGVTVAHSSLERNNEIHLGNKTRRMTVNRLSDPGFDGEIRADRVKSTKTGRPVLPVVRFKGVGVQDKFSMEHTERFVQAQYWGIVVPGLKGIATMQPEDFQILQKN